MSTKIYDGMIFESDNLTKFYNIIEKIDTEAKIIKDDLIIKLIAKKYQYYFDNKITKEEIIRDFHKIPIKEVNYFLDNKYPLLYNLRDLINYRCKNVLHSMERDVDYDLDLVINFAPVNKNILIYPYYEYSEYGEVLLKYFSKYGYWNNSDKPDNISSKDWNTRRKRWDKVIDGKMLCYNLINNTDNVLPKFFISKDDKNEFVDKLLNSFSSLEERAAKYAKNKYINDYVKLHAKPTDNGFNSVYRAIDTLETDVAKNEILKITEEILSTLQEITHDILLNYHFPVETPSK